MSKKSAGESVNLDGDAIKCHSCGRFAKAASLKVDGFVVRGWKCICGQEYLNSDDAQWLLLRNKTKNAPYLAAVSKVGNSYSVRLPKELVDLLDLKGQRLKIQVGLRELCLTPA